MSRSINKTVQRKYELKKRAERQEQTRRRIAQATLELHSETGPARTTISAIAERAGVERLTVYRHFPEPLALNMACSGLHYELNPFPDPESWAVVRHPDERLRAALAAIYPYYRRHRRLLGNVHRDAETDPVVQEVLRRRSGTRRRALELLCEGRPRRKAVRAAIGHALAFPTWRSLALDQGLTDEEAARLMLCLVRCA